MMCVSLRTPEMHVTGQFRAQAVQPTHFSGSISTGEPPAIVSTTPPPLTCQLVQVAPGALLYSAPPLEAPLQPRHRDEGWVPGGSPEELSGSAHDEPEHLSALEYAEHIGRIGLLAAALGIGAIGFLRAGVKKSETSAFTLLPPMFAFSWGSRRRWAACACRASACPWRMPSSSV